MREAVEGEAGTKEEEEKKKKSHVELSQRTEREREETEAKREEDTERSRKQEADKQRAEPTTSRDHRTRLSHDAADLSSTSSEKAPLLSAHQRYGHHPVLRFLFPLVNERPANRLLSFLHGAAMWRWRCSCARHAGFNQVVSGDGCCATCVLM